jgi:hypothetical protein
VEQAPRRGRARRVATFVLKVVVVLVLIQFPLVVLSFLPLWAYLAITIVVIVAAVATPWRPFWRRELDGARTLRRTTRGRLALAIAIALGGPAFDIAADYWLAGRYPRYAEDHWLAGPVWDVLFAAPFWLLGVLVLVTALSRPAALVGAILLGVITMLAFWGVATSDLSTAAVGFLIPWFYGFPGIVLLFLIDAAVRGLVRRHAREM